jgi:hypothetical protein
VHWLMQADSRERRERDRAREAEDVTPFLERKDGAVNRGGASLNLKKEKSNVSEWKAPDGNTQTTFAIQAF